MSEVTYCATGCTVRGAHRGDCDPQATACDGCRPRIAEHGTLCRWCFTRLTADVHDTPALVAHLLEVGRPFAQSAPPREVFTPGSPAETTVRPAAWDAADELHALLASYAHLVLEEHPAGAHMAGPDETWTIRTQSTLSGRPGDPETYVRHSAVVGLGTPPAPTVEWVDVEAAATDALAQPILDRDGQPIRYLVRAPRTAHRPEAPTAATATARLCAWLTPHLPWIAEQEWAAEMRRELKETAGTNRARWPQVDTRVRTIKGVQCVRCGMLGLTYRPPNFPGASALVTCSHPECGKIYTESELDGALGRLAVERGYVA